MSKGEKALSGGVLSARPDPCPLIFHPVPLSEWRVHFILLIWRFNRDFDDQSLINSYLIEVIFVVMVLVCRRFCLASTASLQGLISDSALTSPSQGSQTSLQVLGVYGWSRVPPPPEDRPLGGSILADCTGKGVPQSRGYLGQRLGLLWGEGDKHQEPLASQSAVCLSWAGNCPLMGSGSFPFFQS